MDQQGRRQEGATLAIEQVRHVVERAEFQQAATDEALAVYRKRILVAFKEVETALVRFTQEQQRRAALALNVQLAASKGCMASLRKLKFVILLTKKSMMTKSRAAV